MNEEEIMKILKDKTTFLCEEKEEAIQCLIDLYNKEKQRNQNIEENSVDSLVEQNPKNISEQEKDIEYLRKYINFETEGERSLDKAIYTILKLHDEEKEKNKKLETLFGFISDTDYKKVDEFNKLINNLAQAIRFMSTNENLTVEDIIKEFSKENEVTEEFMERWEKSQYEESHLKDKVIDMMAEEILNLDIKMSKDRYDSARVWDTKEGIKEYYFKVAKENEK